MRGSFVPDTSAGNTVIADNLASHKVTGLREAVETIGATTNYLPPLSLDIISVEQLKAVLRKTAIRHPTGACALG